MRARQEGITLLELMIVLVVIALLAAIALPTYNAQVTGSRRADGQGTMMAFAQAMERFYTDNNTYVGTSAAVPGAPIAAVFPSEAPLDGTIKYYDLTIRAATATTYTLRATPKGGQAGDGMIELDSTGARRWDRDNSGGFSAAENTWNK